MAKDQRNVEAITPMEVDFAKWYTDICLKAELVDYASVKGFMILRPYGYAIWENIQRIMDGMFKKTGHVNVAMPVLIPESLLKKEGGPGSSGGRRATPSTRPPKRPSPKPSSSSTAMPTSAGTPWLCPW